MEILIRFFKIILCLTMIANLVGCDQNDTVTIITELETDTYISTDSTSNNSALPYLSISKSGASESRALFKLPTGNRDEDDNLNDCIKNIYCFVFFMPMAILQSLIQSTCTDASFTAANLNWAQLEFDTNDNSTVPAGSIDMMSLDKPWWHTANWTTAHPFTSEGKWTTLGGDLNTTTNFDTNCGTLTSGESCTGSQVKFELTTFMKALLSSPNTTHYGFALTPTGSLSEVQLLSVQGGVVGKTPRLVANYNCISPAQAATQVFHLGISRL